MLASEGHLSINMPEFERMLSKQEKAVQTPAMITAGLATAASPGVPGQTDRSLL